mmetsp:Transcript_29489/g.32812  ORF Transcript_29489/g.32812 Transcript_29489/m.32812 type:complete len:218 (+) Transcript_29489:1295-1948(+)
MVCKETINTPQSRDHLCILVILFQAQVQGILLHHQSIRLNHLHMLHPHLVILQVQDILVQVQSIHLNHLCMLHPHLSILQVQGILLNRLHTLQYRLSTRPGILTHLQGILLHHLSILLLQDLLRILQVQGILFQVWSIHLHHLHMLQPHHVILQVQGMLVQFIHLNHLDLYRDKEPPVNELEQHLISLLNRRGTPGNRVHQQENAKDTDRKSKQKLR